MLLAAGSQEEEREGSFCSREDSHPRPTATSPSQVEQRLEPAKRAAHNVHKRLQACLQGQSGADMDKRVVSGGSWEDPGRRFLSNAGARSGLGSPLPV